jgi:hypothetical protein
MKTMKNISLILLVAVILAFNSTSMATILIQDNFAYSNGNLAGQDSWIAYSGIGQMPVQVSNGTIILKQGSGSREDVSKSLGVTMQAGDKFYAAMDVTVTADNADVYFAFFRDNGTGFTARTGVTTPTSTGDFTFALFSGNSTTPIVTKGLGDFMYGQRYRVVTAYDFTSGTTDLWVNPINESSSKIEIVAYLATPIKNYAFRQATGSNSVQTIDNLLVGTSFSEVVPEPATICLLAIGSFALLGSKQKA